jgi:hypothetical protein
LDVKEVQDKLLALSSSAIRLLVAAQAFGAGVAQGSSPVL